MKHLVGALVVLAMLAGVAEASVEFSQTVTLNEHLSWGETLGYQHDISRWVPEKFIVKEAMLDIDLTDDQDRHWFGSFEMSLVTGEGNIFAIGFPEIADIEIDVASLNDDGILSVYITSLAGDFIAVDSTLSGVANPVPEPATMILFAMGGIATAASRMRKKK